MEMLCSSTGHTACRELLVQDRADPQGTTLEHEAGALCCSPRAMRTREGHSRWQRQRLPHLPQPVWGWQVPLLGGSQYQPLPNPCSHPEQLGWISRSLSPPRPAHTRPTP